MLTASAGLLVTLAIAATSKLLGALTPLPSVFFALLTGLLLAPFAGPQLAPGVALAARQVLRIGVALLGVTVTFQNFLELGWETAAITLVAFLLTLLIGITLAQRLGARRGEAIVSAGAVAICGASAALAIAASLPKGEVRESEVARTVAAITVVGTAGMLILPLVAQLLALNAQDAGLLIGGTLHEVAQAVGAGFAVNDDVGRAATIVKLLRVACLGAVVIGLGLAFRRQGGDHAERVPLLPLFLIAFLALSALASLQIIPAALTTLLAEVSRWCLLMAIAALGLRTSMKALFAGGLAPIAAIVANSLLLLALVSTGLWIFD